MLNPINAILQFHSLTLLVLVLSTTATGNLRHHHHHYHRRILHQPLYPLGTTISPALPPASSPQYPHFPQQQQPKLPFSTTPPRPFFPTFPSPASPPPPPPFLATFPANISSLLFPQSPSDTSSSRHHILLTVSLSVSLLSAALLISLAAFLFLYRKNHRHGPFSPSTSPRKASHAIDTARLFPPNTAPSTPKTRNSSNHSRNSPDFLYLGTLSNTQKSNDDASSTNSSSVGSKLTIPGLSSTSAYHKIGSPELNPLPPLPRHNFFSKNQKAEEEEEEDGDEEFFSPRGSSGRKENQSLTPEQVHAHAHVSSSSRREFSGVGGVGVDPYGSRSFNSRTASYPYSNSISSSRSSVSNTASPPINLSPQSLKSSSPDTILKFPAPSRPPRPNTSSLCSQSSASPSASEKDIEEENEEKMKRSSSVRIMPKRIPPPPPPIPPLRFWEYTAPVADPPQVMENQNTGPPVLSVPSIPKGLQSNGSGGEKSEETTPNSKPKLKPLHWDKVRASSDRAMVWDQFKSSSFQLNEEMIETLFMVNGSSLPSKDNHNRCPSMLVINQENRVLDPKKSQNIAILLRALNVTIDEVCEALMEGNADSLGSELLESLLKMAPSKEEEYKLKEFKDESPFKLGPAEKFLRAVLDIPFAFKRVDAMLYVVNFDAEIEYLKRSFETLQVACAELKNSKMFLKLLEAVLKTGNRMNVGTNRGDAHAFKLDTLLKLVDVKGTDGKTTLLHFVVQEIVRAEGSRILGADESSQRTEQSALRSEVEFRKLGLQVVSSLGGELSNVKKAATMDSCVLSNEVSKLGEGVAKIRDVIKLTNEAVVTESGRKFLESMIDFLSTAEREITGIQSLERAALSMVREITEYFHGDTAKEEAHPFRIFMVVRDFLSTLDQVCKEVGKINERTIYGSARSIPANPGLPPIFPVFAERKQSVSSEDKS